MKINSNTVKLEKESYKQLEEIAKKIASENKIENVENIQIKLSKDNGVVKFAIIDDWAEYPEVEDWEGADEDETDPEIELTKSTGPRYTIYHSGGLSMNGDGIDYIIDNEDEERMDAYGGLEAIIEDLSGTHPEFYDYEFHIYIGGDMSGPSLYADYNSSTTPDDAIDKINEWLWQNTTFEKIGGEEE